MTQSQLCWNRASILTSPDQSEETDDEVPEEVNTELKSSRQVTVQLTANSTDITEPVLEFIKLLGSAQVLIQKITLIFITDIPSHYFEESYSISKAKPP